jgi:hypothetical protein
VRGFVRRLRRRSLDDGQALRQAIRAHSVVRGADAPNAAGPDTELAVTPGAHAHRAAFPSENPASTGSVRGRCENRPGRRRRLVMSRGRGDSPRSIYSAHAPSQESSDFVSAPRGRSCPPRPRPTGSRRHVTRSVL